jgi:2-keto-4-pentenoate hydratase
MLKKLATWLKELFFYPPELKEMQKQALETNRVYESALQKAKPALKKATTRKEKQVATKPGLYANIHAKQKRIEKEKAEGKPVETMRKPGTKGAPTAKAFKESAKTTKKDKK